MHAVDGTQHAAQPHVLVVDDDADITALVSRYLGRHGCRVSTAANGAQLRAFLVEQPIDLILLDLGLPDEDGLALLRHLQSHWHGPVIVISGRGECHATKSKLLWSCMARPPRWCCSTRAIASTSANPILMPH